MCITFLPCARISLACILPTNSRHLCRLIAYLWTQLVLVSFYLYRIELASNCNCSNAKEKEKERRAHYMECYSLSSFLFLISNHQTTGLPITDRPQRLHSPKTCTELNDLSLSRHYQFISFIFFPPFRSSADGCTGKSYQLTLKNKLRLTENNNKYMYV